MKAKTVTLSASARKEELKDSSLILATIWTVGTIIAMGIVSAIMSIFVAPGKSPGEYLDDNMWLPVAWFSALIIYSCWYMWPARRTARRVKHLDNLIREKKETIERYLQIIENPRGDISVEEYRRVIVNLNDDIVKIHKDLYGVEGVSEEGTCTPLSMY